jgi:hypothetical protein
VNTKGLLGQNSNIRSNPSWSTVWNGEKVSRTSAAFSIESPERSQFHSKAVSIWPISFVFITFKAFHIVTAASEKSVILNLDQ